MITIKMILEFIVACFLLICGLYLFFIDDIDLWILKKYEKKLTCYQSTIKQCLETNQDVPLSIIKDVSSIRKHLDSLKVRRNKWRL